MKIVIDAMGGDFAPREIVKGAVQSIQKFDDITLILTGDEPQIQALLAQEQYDKARIEVVHTTQVIEMCDSPVKAIREKADSSMVVALQMVAEGKAQMMISAGSTGALVAGATLIVKRIPGIKRPALAPLLPTTTGQVMLVDCGANVDCKAAFLQQFGIMGSIYMQKVYGIEQPRVALINNGSEEEKGNELTKEAYQLLKRAPINFVGNAEGRDLLSGDFDVLVCDGFTGNILLKFVEGCAKTILGMLKKYIYESVISKIGAGFMKPAFRKLKKKMDYKEYGGALLLGLNGGVVKAHGTSDAKVIVNSVENARKFIAGDVVSVIRDSIAQMGEEP